MRCTRYASLALVAALAAAALAQNLEQEKARDVVLRALVDEIERNQDLLVLEDLERPYFIEFALQDARQFVIAAELGSVVMTGSNRDRTLRTEVRVGSYELDNTNFEAGFGYRGRRFRRGGGGGAASVPIEDDYHAIRQAIWWATDRQYKDVVETFEQKKAFMQGKLIEDKPADFSREEPVVYLEDRPVVELHEQELERLALELSRIFRDHPEIEDSSVRATAVGGHRYLVNTEGTRIRIAGHRFAIEINAQTRADDGMELADSVTACALKFADLPTEEELRAETVKMVKRLIALRTAPVLETYNGPVLLAAQPAAELFGSFFADRFAGGQRPVGSSSNPDDFENKIGQRLFPRYIRIVDDPTLEAFANVPLIGHYQFDHQGVLARPVTLVDGGRLEAQVMSRNPSRIADRSTGHGRGTSGPSASTSVLLLTGDDPLSDEQLHQELLSAARDEGLDFGILIARLGETGGGSDGFSRMRMSGGRNPLEIYKVYEDGRRELVRGVELSGLDLRAFKQLLGVGQRVYVYNQSATGQSFVAPAMLFEELDLAKIDRDFDKPPFMPNPVGR
jgi:predicted Zn-dependent protease